MEDNDSVEENLWELFKAECDRTKTYPTISDFSVWKEDNGYNDDQSDTLIPNSVYLESAKHNARKLLSE